MKHILIKLAALGLLFSVVSTYACDSCGCNHKESVHVFEHNKGHPTVTKESNSHVNEGGKKIPDPWARAEEPSDENEERER